MTARTAVNRLSPGQLKSLQSLFKLYEARFILFAAPVLAAAGSRAPLPQHSDQRVQLPLWSEPEPRRDDVAPRVFRSPLIGKPERGPGEEYPSPVALSPRGNRLAWASQQIGRTVTSFSELRSDEASLLIDDLKKALGQKVTPPRSSRRPDRDQARAYGIAGRSDNDSKEIRMVDDATLELMDNLRAKLGWSQARFDAFLKSSSSPVRGGAIRTLNQANRVIWALKNMMRRAGSVSSNKEDTPA